MAWKLFIRKGIMQRLQRAGLPDDGPLTPSLKAMSALNGAGEHISPLGNEVARLTTARNVWVLFVHTAGSGAAPWRGQIVLDMDYRKDGQVASPANVGLVAHELTHVFQRSIKDRRYWPSGGLRIIKSLRLIGDSTNYMEVLSYLVGWTVEYDLLAHEIAEGDLSPQRRDRKLLAMGKLADRIATVSAPDAGNATRFILKLHSGMGVYRQNYRAERADPDGRIPPGGWDHWLRVMGFSARALTHVQTIADTGAWNQVSVEEADRIAGLKAPGQI